MEKEGGKLTVSSSALYLSTKFTQQAAGELTRSWTSIIGPVSPDLNWQLGYIITPVWVLFNVDPACKSTSCPGPY